MAKAIPKWHEKTQETLDTYDRALLAIRRKLGSYDTIAQKLYAHTGESCTGVSLRRWFRARNLPITWAASLCEIMAGELSIYDLFPYLESVVPLDFYS